MIKKFSTKGMSREDWLKHRQSTIGGSDAAAIVGLNEYCSPYMLWAQKTGRIDPPEDNEAMRQGRDLEEYVASRFCEATGKKVQKSNYIWTNTEYPWAHANLDRLVVGEKAGLECKTTSSLNLKRIKDGDYPAYYYVQCVHYLAVTGLRKWYLAVLVLNKGFYVFEIERDEAEIAALMQAEKDFHELIKSDTPPAVDGSWSTDNALKTIYADAISNEDPVDLTAWQGAVEKYLELNAQIKELEKEKDKHKQELMEALQTNEFGMCDLAKITWKAQSRSTFQVDEFQKDYPEIDLSNYYKVSNFRMFKINPFKK